MEKLNFKQKLEAPLEVLWANYKWFLIVFGVFIVFYKFKDIVIDLLLKDSKSVIFEANKINENLKKEETVLNKQANDLIKESNDLNKNKPSVEENWHLKK